MKTKTQIEQEFKNLVKRIKETRGEQNVKKLEDAWLFAKLAHGDALRKNGEYYITHPLATAELLYSWKLDITSVIAGILHDTIEDGGATHADILKEFGEEVATLVEGVTKVSNIRLKNSSKEQFVETLRKMILVMAKDLRVVFVKLADRMHNMRTLSALPLDKQSKIAKETLEVFAPLAERLGMGAVKAELEDLSFQYLYPEEYSKLIKDAQPFYMKTKEHISRMEKELKKSFEQEKVEATVSGRQKHLYSLWRKLKRPEIGGDFNNIFDIVALRIIVSKVADCYAALGIVHALYKPAPKLGISDFIAQPKPNGYRSIHTKVFGLGGRIVEVQIRTQKMHEEAEHGAAAHWVYSEAKSQGASDAVLEGGLVETGAKLNWVKEIVSWQKQIADSDEFLKAVKFDVFKHRNFVFSPKGDVFDLPADATPVDFAFAVHTKLGLFITGAKVNGKIVTLDHKLKSGDVVEILKSKNEKKPSRHWLEFVVTTGARRTINKFYNESN